MKKEGYILIKRSHFLMVIVGILILCLSTCAAPVKGGVNSNKSYLTPDPRCTTGLNTFHVDNDREEYGLYTFIINPNEGCNIPPQLCVTNEKGISCTTIEP